MIYLNSQNIRQIFSSGSKLFTKVISRGPDLDINCLQRLSAGLFFMLLLSFAFFSQKLIFSKNLSGILLECQTVWSKIRTLSVLILVQTLEKSRSMYGKS